jgi:putative ABC transport system permease protein
MIGLCQDSRSALRQLRNKPVFALTAVLTLALGIGATAAMFSVIDAVVLRPFPYRNVDRIVVVQTNDPSGSQTVSSWPAYLDMRKLNGSFQALAAYEDYWGMTLSTGKQSRYLQVTQGSDNFFDVFGVRPILGRTFLSGEDQPGKNDLVVLSYEVWRQDFNADPQVVNKTVHLDGQPYAVIGVMPAGFRFSSRASNALYIPMHVRPSWVNARDTNWLMTVGRMKSGITVEQAQADVAHVMQQIGQQYPATDKGRSATVIPLTTALHGNELSEITVMAGAVLAVLLIACANVAGLLLARGIAREREMSLRVAIGAARSRLVRQLLVENALLGIMGAGAGLLLAGFLLTAMKVFLAHAFMRGNNIHLNVYVMALTLCAGIFSSIGAGLIPAWRAAKTAPNHALKSGTTTGTSRKQHEIRASFVVVQIALSLILVVFSGLLLLSLHGMLQADLGFNPQHLLALQINIPSGGLKGHFVKSLLEPLEQHAQAVPGVIAAGFIDEMPIVGYGSAWSKHIVGQPPDPPDRERFSETRSVSAGYFSALGVPVVRGRNFGPQDTPNSQPVAIVNEAWVKEFLPTGEDPLAQAFQNRPGLPNRAIVGVARDVRQSAREKARPEIDFPFSQLSQELQKDVGSFNVTFFVRTAVPTMSVVPQLRETMRDLAPAIAFQTPVTIGEVLDDTLVTNRMESWLFGIFAGIAVLLAVIGIYGLLMQEVTSRIRDIGVRMALGATRSKIAQTVLARISLLTGIGLGVGVLLTILLRRVVSSALLIQYKGESIVIAALVMMMAFVGLLAALLPARRAAKVDPMVALRYE